MANRDNVANQRGFQEILIDQAESAFLEEGWRIDREAAIRASQDVRDRNVNLLVQSRAWRKYPPRRVDSYKGKEVEKMLRRFARADGDDVRISHLFEMFLLTSIGSLLF